MEKYMINKILSNNVVLVEKKNQNYILVGKGIGFGRKKGEILEDIDIIEESFISLKGLNENEYETFIATVDPKVIELSEQIFELAKKELGESLNPNVHVGLIDHINFAIKRIKEGIEIVNPFLFETKLLYPIEYSLAEKAVEILKGNLELDIPEAEVGFLALHIYGGRGNKNKKEALENSMTVNSILKYVEKKLKIDIEDHPFDYSRLVMHLKGVFSRVSKNKSIENIFLSKIKEEISFEYNIAFHVGKMIEKVLKASVSDSEIGFIALHLHKLNSQK